MSSCDRESPGRGDRGSRPGPPFSASALAAAALVLTAVPLGIAFGLPVPDAAAALDLRGAALLIGTVSL